MTDPPVSYSRDVDSPRTAGDQIFPGMMPRWTAEAAERDLKVIDTPYAWGGLPYPRVTAITKVWRQPELEQWQMALSVETALNMPPPSPAEFVDKKRLAMATPFTQRNKAGERGTRIHTLVEQYLNGVEVVAPPELAASFHAAAVFCDRYVDTVAMYERACYNATFEYAGTPDLFVVLRDGRTALLDWKTGKAIRRPVSLELAAYANAEWADWGDGIKHEVPHADTAWAVHIRPDDGSPRDPGYRYGFGIWECPDPFGRPWRAFVACRTLAHYEDHHAEQMGRIV